MVDIQDERLRVLCWFEHDNKVFLYRFTDEELQVTLEVTPEVKRIYWLMEQEEFEFFFNLEGTDDTEVVHNNLKEDFIWFRPSVSGMQRVECTCDHFLEAGHDLEKLSKLAVAHMRRTGHTLNPRGN